MNIINLVDTLDQVNFGIWNAALSTATILKEKWNVDSEVWAPAVEEIPAQLSKKVIFYPLVSTSVNTFDQMLEEKKYPRARTIFISHGCWRYPTRWGAMARKRGYCWIHVPHGMLEPWPLRQKWLQKKIYFFLIEKRLSKKAHVVRAVSQNEFRNLQKYFSNIRYIPNGVPEIIVATGEKWIGEKRIFLFMARLHHKKGVVPLVEAWVEAGFHRNSKLELRIAGPDDGELESLKKIVGTCGPSNITIVGAVYGSQKEKELAEAHFYVLPSYSEGFPTSVLEGMQSGAIPIISEGCNFPEVFSEKLGIETSPGKRDIGNALKQALELETEREKELSAGNQEYVNKNYSLEFIAEQQYMLYKDLLS